MGDLISYVAHQGIVRVLSVPAMMILLIYLLWTLAAPPKGIDDADTHRQA